MAYGESWIVWTKKVNTDVNMKYDITWEIETAFPDYESCIVAKQKAWEVSMMSAQAIKNAYRNAQPIQSATGEIVSIIFNPPDHNTFMMSTYLYCLPGTIDPREKKQ
jgi:hypothetical protein